MPLQYPVYTTSQQQTTPNNDQLQRQVNITSIESAATGNTADPDDEDEHAHGDTMATRSAPNRHHSRYEISHAVENMPEFDPEGRSGKTKSARTFIARLRALQAHYEWSDFLLLEAAQQKLRGQAKQWNEESPLVYTTFAQFEADLIAAYPSFDTKADVIEEILAQKRAPGELMETFCRRMAVLGRRTLLPEDELVQYIIKRINYPAFVTSIGCMDVQTIADLLKAIAMFAQKCPERWSECERSSSTGTIKKMVQFPYVNKSNNSGLSQQKDRPPAPNQTTLTPNSRTMTKCWNCRDAGHTLQQCPKPLIKCSNCSRYGHNNKECKSTPRLERVLRIDGNQEDAAGRVVFQRNITVDGLPAQAYVDGGSNRSLITRSLADKLGGGRATISISIRGFNGEPVTSSEIVTPTIHIDDQTYMGDVYIVDDEQLEPEDILLGTDLLCGIGKFMLIGDNKCTLVSSSIAECAESNRSHVTNLLNEYKHCFSATLDELGETTTTSMRIQLTNDKPIQQQRGCRIPFAKRPAVSQMIQELLSSGIVVPSESPYSAQLVIVKKASGEDRLCVDYRPLNAVTVRHQYPMPIVEELLAKLAGNRFFTTLDFMSGYYQVPIHPDSRHYTAFNTHEGHYEFARMPFGLVNAPSVFQACIDNLVRMVPPGEAVAYLDDIVIPSATIQEGIHRLHRFLEAITDTGMTLRMEKCVFLSERIKFLGHNISEQGVAPGDNKVAAIRDFPVPTDVHGVRRFIGLTGFFRKFVKEYARISKPLTELLKTTNGAKFEWRDEQQTAFESLKLILCTEPVLCLFDAERRHEIHTDASAAGLAGVLMQEQDDGKIHPVFYFSRHTTPAESRYSSHELEILAVVATLDRFRVYLIGKPFTIVTDCAAITTTKATKQLIPRIARWWLRLQEFDFELQHRPGTQMCHVDAMSRAPVEPATEQPNVTERIMRVDITQADWVATMQRHDKKLQRIMDALNGTIKVDDLQQLQTDYTIKKNRLFRKVDGQLRWVVPDAVRWRIVKSAHDDRGHFGLEKTLQHLQGEFWFVRMRNYVLNYLQACVQCAYNKRHGGAPEGQLHISTTDPTPFRTVHVDHLGPFPKSSKGNAYVLAIVEAFSRYVVVKAVRATDTRAVITLFNEMSSYFGVPARIVSDRGTAFTSKNFGEYCGQHGIQHIENAVRTPRANGQVERVNSMIATFLRTSDNDARKWDDGLHHFQAAINSQINKTTGCCPNEIIFRYKLRNQMDNKLIAALHETDEEVDEIELPKYEEIAQAIDKEKIKWKARFDKRHNKPTQYTENDMVLVENVAPSTGESRKLEPKYRGPYMVKRVLGSDRYVITDIPDMQRTQRAFESVFASDKMKAWCALGPEAADTNDDYQLIDADGEGAAGAGRAEL